MLCSLDTDSLSRRSTGKFHGISTAVYPFAFYIGNFGKVITYYPLYRTVRYGVFASRIGRFSVLKAQIKSVTDTGSNTSTLQCYFL